MSETYAIDVAVIGAGPGDASPQRLYFMLPI